MAKLLIAEDDEFSRDMLARRLERRGYEVIATADGREALAAALHHRPDVIIMDLDMPVMDGRNAVRWLKTDVRTFKIPVIILSAHTSTDNVTGALAAGCNSFEAKPVVLRRLVERIEEALQSSARRRPAESTPG